MHRYYKRFWDENRGDEFSEWGTSLWFFEIDEKGFVMRQMEIYQSGIVLKYDESLEEDKYGGLAQLALDTEEYSSFLILKEEFEKNWSSHTAFNN